MSKLCHDCQCEEGQLHDHGCDMERCPFCGHQLISCDCKFTKLGFKYEFSAKYSGLPEDIYKEGLPDNLYDRWTAILEKEGRIPYIRYHLVCRQCGQKDPEMFNVPDWEWKYYIQRSARQVVICQDCYNNIKKVIDKHTSPIDALIRVTKCKAEAAEEDRKHFEMVMEMRQKLRNEGVWEEDDE